MERVRMSVSETWKQWLLVLDARLARGITAAPFTLYKSQSHPILILGTSAKEDQYNYQLRKLLIGQEEGWWNYKSLI